MFLFSTLNSALEAVQLEVSQVSSLHFSERSPSLRSSALPLTRQLSGLHLAQLGMRVPPRAIDFLLFRHQVTNQPS